MTFIVTVSLAIFLPIPVMGQSSYIPYYNVPYNMSDAVSGVDLNSTVNAVIAQANVAASTSSGPAVVSGRPSGSGSANESQGGGTRGGPSLQEAFSGVTVFPTDPNLQIYGVVNYTGPGSNSTIGTYDR